MLWFFVGAGASLSWHARLLDEETLGRCAYSALADTEVAFTWGDYRDARFVGDATVTFEVSGRRYDDGDREIPMVLECTLGVADDSGDGLVVERARVVG